MGKKLGIIGMGKLGYCLLAILNNELEDWTVIGVDVKENPPVPSGEPFLKEYLQQKPAYITTDYAELDGCDIVFCIVPTPSEDDGGFSDAYVRAAMLSVKPYLKEDGVFNLVSTVMPGTSKRLSEEFGMRVTYNPEFIALGQTIEGMLEPDFVLIGEENKEDGDKVLEVYEAFCEAPVKRMDLTSAELTKIGLNAYVTQKITFANIMGEVADEYGCDAKRILDAIGTDKRIGTRYFNPYGAYGGFCFPRDNRAFTKAAKGIKTYSVLTDEINKHIAKKYGYFSDDERFQNA